MFVLPHWGVKIELWHSICQVQFDPPASKVQTIDSTAIGEAELVLNSNVSKLTQQCVDSFFVIKRNMRISLKSLKSGCCSVKNADMSLFLRLCCIFDSQLIYNCYIIGVLFNMFLLMFLYVSKVSSSSNCFGYFETTCNSPALGPGKIEV